MDTETQTENDAALACVAAMTRWFDNDPTGATDELSGQDPAAVSAFLFGMLVSTVDAFCEELSLEPADYVRGVAVTVAEDVYGIV